MRYSVIAFKSGYNHVKVESISNLKDLPVGGVLSSKAYENALDAVKFKLLLDNKISNREVIGFHSPIIVRHP
jgi:hypothetical protein